MIGPRVITKELSGKSFTVKDAKSGANIKFSFPSSLQGWPRRGSEGIVTPIICHHPHKGDIPSILKCFDHAIPERNKRQASLVQFGLASKNESLYQGVPYTWIDKEINGHRIYGHIAKHVCFNRGGDDFRIVREQELIDDFTETDRRDLAAQLCNAIVGLEKLGIVHGDLSPANIVIEKQAEGDVHCILIDYDGYRHATVPNLPRMHGKDEIRLFGSPGYQHPSLMRKLEKDRKNPSKKLFVENDRFALAVLCFEIFVWNTQISKNLDTRTHLLDLDELKIGKLVMPDSVQGIWPEGYSLLKQAVEESDPNSLPSPTDWLRALGFLGEEWIEIKKDWTSVPFLKIFRQHGNSTPTSIHFIEFGNQSKSKGNFSQFDKRLSDVFYEYEIDDDKCESLKISHSTPNPVILKRDGIIKNLGASPGAIEVGPGDKLLSDCWVFEFQDRSLGTK